ncbi:MAG: FkbM family methyltransferase [Deltaproteobacteria bacterium]|nr:FkbM family methyltransferase [Deltaproteobacteria bacterium]
MIQYIVDTFKIRGIVHVGMHYGQEMPFYISKNLNVLGFEPMAAAYTYLRDRYSSYQKFRVLNCALCDYSGEAEFYLTSNDRGASSSLLKIGDHMDKLYPFVKYAGTEKVTVTTLEKILKERDDIHLDLYDFLIIDTQGSELQVLKGINDYVGKFRVLLVECSEKPIYEGGNSAAEVVSYLETKGFKRGSEVLPHGDVLFLGASECGMEVGRKLHGGNGSSVESRGNGTPKRYMESDSTRHQHPSSSESMPRSLDQLLTQNQGEGELENYTLSKENDKGGGGRHGISKKHKGLLPPAIEEVILADAMYRLGKRKTASKYAAAGFESLQGISELYDHQEEIPERILNDWDVKNIVALLSKMWLKLTCYSSYFARKESLGILQFWMEHDHYNPEPFLRYGLLLTLDSLVRKTTAPAVALKSLLYADKLLNNDRSSAAVIIGDRGCVNKMTVPYDDVHIHVYPSLLNMSTYVLLEQGDWFEDDLLFFRNLVRSGDRILDVGANIGVYSVSAARRAGNDGCVVSIEPSKGTYDILSRNAANFKNMHCLQMAVGDQRGKGVLDDLEAPELRSLRLGQQRGKGEIVDIATLDDLGESLRIDEFDIIKMDVEGHELAVLDGAKKIVEQSAPIVFYEIRENGIVNSELIKRFSGMGYNSYVYRRPENALVRYQDGCTIDPYVLNLVAVRPESLGRLEGVVHIA